MYIQRNNHSKSCYFIVQTRGTTCTSSTINVMYEPWSTTVKLLTSVQLESEHLCKQSANWTSNFAIFLKFILEKCYHWVVLATLLTCCSLFVFSQKITLKLSNH